MKIPYYVAASFNADTLPGPQKVRIGDGSVIGGYLNYPLVKGKKYNHEIYSVWELDGKPAAVARQRGKLFLSSSFHNLISSLLIYLDFFSFFPNPVVLLFSSKFNLKLVMNGSVSP